MLSSCQYLTLEDCPPDYPEIATRLGDPLMRGDRCIVAPTGELLVAPRYDERCILYADLDLDEVTRGKYDLDVVGHYARPDVSPAVDERPRPSYSSTNSTDHP